MILEEIAERQSSWSATANALEQRLRVARWLTFSFSIAGALLAAIASQLDQAQSRLYFAIAGSIVLAVVSFLSARSLGGTQLTNWIRARAASEALKAIAFEYASGASPYNDPATRDGLINVERDKIEEEVDDLSLLQVPSTNPSSSPKGDLKRNEYVKQRVSRQVSEFYRPKAEAYQIVARRLRAAEFALSLLATILTAVIGVAGKEVLGVKFDFISITAVLTTMAGAILAHIEASRYEFLITMYRSAARRLTKELSNVRDFEALSPAEWSAFVTKCESIISQENSAWIAKWSKPKA